MDRFPRKTQALSDVHIADPYLTSKEKFHVAPSFPLEIALLC